MKEVWCRNLSVWQDSVGPTAAATTFDTQPPNAPRKPRLGGLLPKGVFHMTVYDAFGVCFVVNKKVPLPFFFGGGKILK